MYYRKWYRYSSSTVRVRDLDLFPMYLVYIKDLLIVAFQKYPISPFSSYYPWEYLDFVKNTKKILTIHRKDIAKRKT